jgi:hypothetical protein
MALRINFTALLLLALAMGGTAQNTITGSAVFALKKLQVGTDTARYFTAISQSITGFSTHRQAPTAKAVYDFVSSTSSTVNTAAPIGGTGTVLDPITIANGAIPYAKIQDVTAQRIIGRAGGLAGPPQELTLGNGMGWSGSAITNTGDTDATNDLTTSTNFTGDVSGTFSTIRVEGFYGRPLNGTAPSNGQVYAWNSTSSQWVPTTVSGGSGTAFEQGGNSFGTAARLGTNDLNRLEFETNNTYAGKVHTNQSWLVGGATTDVPGTKLHVAGDFRADGTVISRGAGVATGSTTASSLRLLNTTASTGQTYNLSSTDAGSFVLWDPFGFQAITLSTGLNFGIYKNVPGRRWDVAGVSRSDVFENGTSSTPTLSSFGTGAGTSPVSNSLNGGQNYFVWTFTTGSSPSAGGVVATISLPTPFTVSPIPVWSGGNDASDPSRFRVGTVTSSTFQIVNRGGALAGSTQYVLYIHVGGY